MALMEISLALITSFWVFTIMVTAADLGKPSFSDMKIQVESHSRDYRTGPVNGFFMLSNRDQLRFTIEHPGDDSIWKWHIATSNANLDEGKLCDLSRIYGRGESVSAICFGEEGVYYACAQKVAVNSVPQEEQKLLDEYFNSNRSICYVEDSCNEIFYIVPPKSLTSDKSVVQELAKKVDVMSDPFEIISTQYCFLWAYQIEEMGKVGYVFTEPEPTGNEGSHIKYRVSMWITAANAMSESELSHKLPQTRHASMLTREFKLKGLTPCLRLAHQAIELLHAHPKFMNDDLGQGFYWTQDFIARTDSTASTLSDISFTIASKQHIGIYGCFVAETRVILDPRQFSFVSPGRNDPQKINIANSDMSEVQMQFVQNRLKHIFGHYAQYIGRPWEYEAAKHRRDVTIFQNPCMTLEFGFAVRGVTYMAQDWLSDRSDDITQITLPRLDEDVYLDNTGQHDENATDLATGYIKVVDFAFTPTHMVALMSDASIFFHPTSVIYKGFGFTRNLKFYRPGALVSRRWCASTVTPKEHNMVVPVFNIQGSFLIIQIIPVEETKSLWMPKPSHSCLKHQISEEESKKNSKKKKVAEAEDENSEAYSQKVLNKQRELQDAMEFCIHRKEAPKVSAKLDELKALFEQKEKECKTLLPETNENQKEKNLDSLDTFWLSGHTLIDEDDPHFMYDKVGASSFRTTSTANYNSHISYEVDRRGAKLKQLFEEQGLEVKAEKRIAGKKEFVWLHDVQFEAEERRFMLAVELKSNSLKFTDFSMAVLNFVILNEPIVIERNLERDEVEVDPLFSGTLVVQFGTEEEPENKERLKGTIRSYTTNTALGNYVLHIQYYKGTKPLDVMLYGTMDGSHARPLTYYNEPPMLGKKVIPKVRFTGQHAVDSSETTGVLIPDMTMTEHGIISVLLRKANTSDTNSPVETRDNYPQSVIIGSIVIPDPLRKVYPFKGDSYIFQRVTADGEIVYGEYSFLSWSPDFNFTETETTTNSTGNEFVPKLLNISGTRFLSTPFESMLSGNDDVDKTTYDDFTLEEPKADQDICPYSDFIVHNIPFDFAEVEYRTRITAEVVYRGTSIPLEADLLVDFQDSHGISVTIHSAVESRRDQTVVRKSVDIHTFLTPAKISAMYNSDDVAASEDEDIREDIEIFSITLRPSIVNLHCRKDLFFKTIQINVGCNPFTYMRFIAEAVGLQKIPFDRNFRNRDSVWTVSEKGGEIEITVPYSKTSYLQRNDVLECVTDPSAQKGRGYCKIPSKYTKLIQENMYSMHFSKVIVPKFEQFLTRHVRRVTGNIMLYNVLDGKILTNTTLLDAGCKNIGSHCAPGDEACGSAVDLTTTSDAQELPWTKEFLEKIASGELDFRTDVYKHYRDCFSQTRLSADGEIIQIPQDLPKRMRNVMYWVFNTTNFNSFKFDKKHRDMIYIMRAAVVNTPDNAYTFCKRLETYFLLQVTGITPARRPLRWEFYLALITLVLFIFTAIYFCFACSSKWKSQVYSRRIREEEEREGREIVARENLAKGENLAQWAKNLRDVAQHKGAGNPVDSETAFSKTHDPLLDTQGGDKVEGPK